MPQAVELDRANLTIGDELGAGAFGVVVKGRLALADGTFVWCACKTLKDRGNAEDLDSLEAEAELVSQFDHENVVKCFGKVMTCHPTSLLLVLSFIKAQPLSFLSSRSSRLNLSPSCPLVRQGFLLATVLLAPAFN